MLQVLLIFSGALAFATGATPVARRLAHRTGMTDTPSARKVHTQPMPLLGGAAIYLAVMLALVVFGTRREVAELAGILIGATLVSFLGLWDDRHPLPASVKLVGQTLAAGVVVAAGVQIQLFAAPWLNVVVSVVWMLTITNAINFMDNMDGVAGGVTAVAAGTFILLATLNGQQLVAPLAAALLGACIGFLVYNFNPATIFMGDGGSMFLGLVLAALAIKLRFPGRADEVTWIVPVLVLAVPLFDLALVLVSRTRRRVNPFTTGGKDHLSHRLVRAGATPREAALSIYLLGCAAGGVAIFASAAAPLEALLVAGAVSLLGLWGLWHLEFRPAHPRTPSGGP
jgi:UDP-GlcNAc:undecaprenyl-phosphate/decaprenyl-phosphate GlcNAc-1-phosphate transferase